MTHINFAHSCDPLRKPLFLDLHFQVYSMLRIRQLLRREFCQAVDLLEVYEPRLPRPIQAALEECEQAEERVRASGLPHEMQHRQVAEINSRRSELFGGVDRLGTDAWRATSGDGQTIAAHRARLRCCEHCLAQLRERIAALSASTKVMDPFAMLAEKYGLDDDEQDILVWLYFEQFERSGIIDGNNLLGEVIGRQSCVFRAQALLVDDGRLVSGGLLEVVEKGRGVLDSKYAISQWANQVISDLHPDHPHLDAQWSVTEGRTA